MIQASRIWSRVRRGIIGLDGRDDAVIRLDPDRHGRFIWAYGNIAGAEESIQRAKHWVEALAEGDDVPPIDRLLGPVKVSGSATAQVQLL